MPDPAGCGGDLWGIPRFPEGPSAELGLEPLLPNLAGSLSLLESRLLETAQLARMQVFTRQGTQVFQRSHAD